MINELDHWILESAGGNGNELGDKTDKQKRVHWASHSNTYAYDEIPSDAFADAGTEDSFLLALDNLEAIVRGKSGPVTPVGSGDIGETSASGSGSLSTNDMNMIEKEPNANTNTDTTLNKKRGGPPNTDDAFWQHAITSLSRG